MKKCIVLDLDNTLWGGVAGEDGFDGISLGTSSLGANFVAFQQALLDLYNRGIILAINSQNNFDDAINIIRNHPNMILKENHFAANRINWQDKTKNIRELAEELNIGLDSMVFIDDNPIQRKAMRAFAPEVETPELPENTAEYAKFLHSLPHFESKAITDEDKMRGNLYVTERLRKEAEKEFDDPKKFLESLGLEIKIHKNDKNALERLSQLTEKTNQFNTNKHPYNTEELQSLMENPKYEVLHARVLDRFGDHGVTAMAIINTENDRWNIGSFLLSCRIIGRGVEEAFLSSIAKYAKERGVKEIDITFKITEKNKPAEIFVEKIFNGGAVLIDDITPPDWIKIQMP
jgi:FkbH-like protein